jgi:diguanylate cyclase (GGDEF)-like protein/PAS domain S-box-containing protein
LSNSSYADIPHWKCASLGMIEWDTAFNVRAWNPGAEQIFGYSEAEISGRNAKLIVPEFEHAKVAVVMERLSAGENEVSLRNLNVRKDGVIITCDWFNTCLLDADGGIAGYASLVQDVSDRASIVDALGGEGDIVQSVLHGAPGMFFVHDEHGRLIQWNSEYEQTTGYSAGELAEMTQFDLISPQEHDRFREVINTVIATGAAKGEFTKIRKDGTELAVYGAGTHIVRDGVGYIMVIAVDITARKKAEASLQLVNTLTKRLYGVMDVDSIAKCTVSTIVEVNDSPQVACYLYDEAGDHLRLVEHFGFDRQTVRKGACLPLDGSLAGLAVTEKTLQISEDLATDQRVEPGVKSLLVSGGIRSGVVIPLICDDRVLGTLNLVYSSARVFDKGERNTLMSVGRTIGLSMSNAIHLARLNYQAQHDSLTGLPNREFLHHECERLKSHVDVHRQRVALILFDIDGFKEINDTLGHHVGDRLLVSISQRVTAALQQEQRIFYRLGGDEFALVQVLNDSDDEPMSIASELLGLLEKPFEIDGLTLEVSASAGMAFYPEQAGNSHELLRCADVAMYHAKRTRSHLEVYAPTYDEHSPERLSLMVDLRQGIRDDQLVLHYQPKVNLHENRVTGFEALVRWQHPQLGLLAPDAFIGFAEMGETIHPLTNWVIDTALYQLRCWQDSGHDLCMAINISTRNLVDQAFPETLKGLIDKHGVEAGSIELEITESSLISNPERTQASLNQIASLGVALSIDDFGTGYSSLSYLKRLPVQTIKIDQSFVTDMLDDQQDLVIVRSTINMARNLGLKVVAEGAEDQATCDTLRGMGCDFVQGYFISKPLESPLVDEGLKNDKFTVLKKAAVSNR